jgi:hypothetical protein
MIRRPLRPSFSHEDQQRLIAALKEARELTVKCSSAQPYNSLLYGRCHDVIGTIDELAGTLTGDRMLFHAKAHGGSYSTKPAG